MKYKLLENGQGIKNLLEQVLYHRGIKKPSAYIYMNGYAVTHHYSLLDNMDKAVNLFDKHYQLKNRIAIIPDSDVDGQCSSAEIYSYIKAMDKDYPITVLYHESSKSHGLSDITVPDDIKLMIIADAGSNDVTECKAISDRGIDIIILDHHDKEIDNPYAVIVNNQYCDYPNKDLCGAGIVYKWLEALDEFYWNDDWADYYLDLVAVANIADSMDMRSPETKYLVTLGLHQINNPFFKSLIEAQSFSMHDKVNIHNIEWYIAPLINALIRVGTLEEKQLMFQAFTEQYEEFNYHKRAYKDRPAEDVIETIYERATRFCKNCKSKQDNTKKKLSQSLFDNIAKNLDDNKVIIYDVSGFLDESLSGLVAAQISDKFNRPCILLHKSTELLENGHYSYRGHVRNDVDGIEDFKNIVNQTSVMIGQGHPNAFGIVNFDINNINIALKELNDLLPNGKVEKVYKVDFEYDIDDISINDVLELSHIEDYLGKGIESPLVLVKNIELEKDDISVFGKTEDTMSFEINGIKYIQFKCCDDNPLYDFVQDGWSKESNIVINVIGEPIINEYQGVRTPQIVIRTLEVIE